MLTCLIPLVSLFVGLHCAPGADEFHPSRASFEVRRHPRTPDGPPPYERRPSTVAPPTIPDWMQNGQKPPHAKP